MIFGLLCLGFGGAQSAKIKYMSNFGVMATAGMLVVGTVLLLTGLSEIILNRLT